MLDNNLFFIQRHWEKLSEWESFYIYCLARFFIIRSRIKRKLYFGIILLRRRYRVAKFFLSWSRWVPSRGNHDQEKF